MISELQYADDTALFSTSHGGWINYVQSVRVHSAKYNIS